MSKKQIQLFLRQIKLIMDAVWYGFAHFMEWIFKIVAPIGKYMDIIFILTIFIGAVYWLWYDMHVRKTGDNFMDKKG